MEVLGFVMIGVAILVALFIMSFFAKRTVRFVSRGKVIFKQKYKIGENVQIPYKMNSYYWKRDRGLKKPYYIKKMGYFGFTLYGTTNLEGINYFAELIGKRMAKKTKKKKIRTAPVGFIDKDGYMMSSNFVFRQNNHHV